MELKITSKKIELTDAIKSKIENTFMKLEKYINDDTDIHVKIDVKKKNQKIEATIFTKSGTILRAEDSEESLYSAIDIVCDKLYKQIRKLKTQLSRKNRKNESIRFDNIEDNIVYDIEEENNIKRRKKFILDKPMTAEDAIVQMDLLGHNFFIFRDLDTEDVSIVYKRHDGYGLIEQF
ncbi:ribosome hibernation-promoting factor, HPF/YfiA family [[Clostridium] dakarense]|uniref:ribosome hibernation-promoting factor, HPF/YfiA family n=1 Tax=Faecalimicrobium dakarense TaxID=1301100 RepID=UPI0004B673DB|nr:ribosome-associated translation inhibitor RaiA [[Clostridium] dakarense]